MKLPPEEKLRHVKLVLEVALLLLLVPLMLFTLSKDRARATMLGLQAK